MTWLIRAFIAILLALVVSLTSLNMAVARADMAIGGIMILCIGAEQVVMAFGADGQPQLEQHICPDCTMGAMVLLAGISAPTPAVTVSTLETSSAQVAVLSVSVLGGAGREPPN